MYFTPRVLAIEVRGLASRRARAFVVPLGRPILRSARGCLKRATLVVTSLATTVLATVPLGASRATHAIPVTACGTEVAALAGVGVAGLVTTTAIIAGLPALGPSASTMAAPAYTSEVTPSSVTIGGVVIARLTPLVPRPPSSPVIAAVATSRRAAAKVKATETARVH